MFRNGIAKRGASFLKRDKISSSNGVVLVVERYRSVSLFENLIWSKGVGNSLTSCIFRISKGACLITSYSPSNGAIGIDGGGILVQPFLVRLKVE